MTQIVADRRQVGSRLQKRYGSTVPHTVRVKPLLAEIRNIGKTLCGGSRTESGAHHGDSETREFWRETLENAALVPRKSGIGHPMAAVLMLRRNVKLEIQETAICVALACQLHIPSNFTFGQPKKAVGHEPQIGPCVATFVIEQQRCLSVSGNRLAPSRQPK